MLRPSILTPRPSTLMLAIGGIAGTILLAAFIYLAPLFGFPFIDVPHLVGGVVAADRDIAFGVGFFLFFAVGAFIFPMPLFAIWSLLPGRTIGIGGPLVKGAIWGGVLWIAGGLLLPAFAALNRVEGIADPGFFAIGTGLLGAVGFLLGHLAYGVVVALTAAMTQGIKPIEVLGWWSHHPGDVRDVAVNPPGRRSL